MRTLSVMTYNVHSCIGIDGKASHERIAEVIREAGPDIIALQELDVGLFRSGLIDQAEAISAQLEMHYAFRPTLFIEQGQYGNAILSRYPLELVKSAELPTLRDRPGIEQRGILWSEIKIKDCFVQVMNTHLGLRRNERILQAEVIAGPEWTLHPDCGPPAVLCCDLNAGPYSTVYRMLTRVFDDAQRKIEGWKPRKTWASTLPVRRIDYIFVNPGLSVTKVTVPRNRLTRVASDHLPLLVELDLSDYAGHLC